MAADGEAPATETGSTDQANIRATIDQLQRLLAASQQPLSGGVPAVQEGASLGPVRAVADDPGGAEQEQTTAPRSRLDNFFGRMTGAWLAPVATGLVTCAVTLFLVSATRPSLPSPGTEIAVFDVDAAMTRLIARPDIAALSPDDPKFAKVVTGFHTALVAEFDHYAREHGVVVISATTVLGGSPKDSTGELVDLALAAVPTVTPTVSAAPTSPAPAPSMLLPAPAPGP